MATNPSVSPQLPQESGPLSEGQRLGYIFLPPSRVFADLRRNASWWAPFLIVAVVSLLFFNVVNRKVGFPRVVENLIRLQPRRPIVLTACRPISVPKSWRGGSRLPK